MGHDTDIKALRQRLGLTQKALADALGVQPNTVARWERGELGISAPMIDRLETVAKSRRSGTVITRSSGVTLDQHHQAILDGLNRRLDHETFEACAADLLRREWPTLISVHGGADDGFDGAVADTAGEPFPLVTTTGAKLVDNLARNLDQAKRKGWHPMRALFATSRRITPATRKKLFDAARVRGVTLRQAYDQDWFAQRLYREPEWCTRLLGVTGSPAALSLFPVTSRPVLGDVVLGREREMRWLLDQTSDCLLVGEPGSGKTFLLRSLALQGHARFLVDDDRTNVANDLRRLHPSAVIVDDAHADPARIANLDQIRTEIRARVRIIATSWPGAADEVRSTLKVGRTAELKLDRIDADTMVEIIKSIGVRGPDRLLYIIQKQAAGRPGLAATLAHLCLSGDVSDVISGEALVADLARSLSEIVGFDTLRLLAPFALGGDAGVRQVPVAGRLGISLFDVSSGLANLAAAGVIRERSYGAISLEPEPIRWVIVKRVFSDGPGSLDIGPFLDIVENRSDAIVTLVGARSRGAGTPDLERWLNEANSPTLWAAYASLGRAEAQYVLWRQPTLNGDIAQPVLINAPETAIPILLDRMENGDTDLSDGVINELKTWVKGIASVGQPVLERRLILVQETIVWWQSTHKGRPALTALCVALQPGITYTAPDPGIGNTTSFTSRMLCDDELRELIAQWPAVARVLAESETVPCGELFELVETWLHPQVGYFPPVKLRDTTLGILRNFACTMLEGMAGASHRHPGIQHRIAELANDVGISLELSLDPTFEALCPSESFDSKDWESQDRQWSDAIRKLAEKWSSRSSEDIVSLLKWCEHEADLAGIKHLRLSDVFCSHLADLVSEPLSVADAMIRNLLPSALVAPFFAVAAARCDPGWTLLAHRCLNEKEYRWTVVQMVLVHRAPPCDLLSAAISAAAEMPNLDAFVYVSCARMPRATMMEMLRSQDSRIAAVSAVGYWLENQGEIPRAQQSSWRRAVLSSASCGSLGGSSARRLREILSKDCHLAVDWLVASLSSADWWSCWRTRDLAKTVIELLGNDLRKLLLARLSVSERIRATPDVIQNLIGGNLALYCQLLDSAALNEHHLDPLTGDPGDEWRALALAALNRGYSVQDVLDATLGRSRPWVGDESDMWAAERQGFEALLNDSDNRVVAIGRAGVEYTSAREEHAIQREREDAVYGRRYTL